ncbi:HET-domain-containing protein [Ophiobolus disseminans]|uniref:HET-domain-containing protein n=1 Tax=Ophiobolus disseminans TaxID=1469910 RepID=A0A6A6ZJ55_9PLEO|nr:HET-domain-containing protein [Ophiobolus disseminans]
MRLLKYGEDDCLTITTFDENAIPRYAILSHTWGEDAEEVTFADLAQDDGKHKPGYEKICFCGEQAQQDRLKYFWVDSCCINKSDKAELSHAIQSMFRWYQNATKCYVYLSDEPAFKSSRWFMRGWTLQELLAPSISLIKKITGIPYEGLDGAPLPQFGYSLLGIFDVKIAPAYSEGAASAFKRLKDKIDKNEICVRDIRHTDPRHDKKRIEDTKGGLLADSYRRVLNNTTFQQWQQDPQSGLLWVKGDPGKGKTMLLCGIINELQKATNDATVSHFFCQATDSRLNSATAVLRGLLYMLVVQQPSLISHLRKKHDYAGKSLFEDANAWIALTEIFVDVLRDPSLRPTCLIIDAIDECVTADLPKLLEFIAKQSRNWLHIEAQLDRAEHRHLTINANNTFLWVALVCQDLQATANRHVLKKLALFPPRLDSLYKRMMHQISESDDAKICRGILASTAISYRPMTIPELAALVEQLEDFVNDLELVREIVSLCGSFLTLRDDTVYFVHQSAKDFLLAKALSEVFPMGTNSVHQAMFSNSLAVLSRTLHRDMYGLKTLGTPVEHVQPPELNPLAASRYSFAEAQVKAVDVFLRKNYLYWLEGLSLCTSLGQGVVSMTKLWLALQETRDQNKFIQLVQDAQRFIMYHRGAIESYPLQTYASALVFIPTDSMIRRLFHHEEPEEITIRPAMNDKWSACLQTLEGHSDYVNSVAFSHDSTRLASASSDSTIKIWDASSGACLQTLEGYSGDVSSAELASILMLQHSDKILIKPYQPVRQRVSISSDNIWVSDDTQYQL